MAFCPQLSPLARWLTNHYSKMHPTIAKIQSKLLKKVPEVKTGYTVRVSQKVKEGSKERIQNFEGLVIKVSHGTGPEKTFTVRKIVEGVGVEKIFPFHSPNITKIHVIKKAKVRREKLYYMRERFGKSARLSEKHVTDEERAAEEARIEAIHAEAVKANEAEKKEDAEETEAKPVENEAETTVEADKATEAIEEKVPAAEEKEEKASEDNAEVKVEEPKEEEKAETTAAEEGSAEDKKEEKADDAEAK